MRNQTLRNALREAEKHNMRGHNMRAIETIKGVVMVVTQEKADVILASEGGAYLNTIIRDGQEVIVTVPY